MLTHQRVGATLASQSQKQMKLSTQAGDQLLFKSMRASEELGCLFEFDVEAYADSDALEPLDLLGTPAHVALDLPGGAERCFHGIVAEMGAEGAASHGLFRWRLVLRPALWLLTRRADTRIFQNLSVPDILNQVFDRFALDVKMQLTGSYAPREYCVQYRESDFNFASRLMEEEGIYYFFEHDAGRHLMVLVDAPDSHAACAGQSQFRFQENERDEDPMDPVTRWHARRRIETGQVVLSDHDWQQPATTLRSTAKASGKSRPALLEVYDYACNHSEASQGQHYASVRLQEAGARERLAQGEGPARALAVGCRFTLSEHPQPAENGEYLVVATAIEMTSSGYFAGDSETRFDCRFSAIPAAQAFRCERRAARTRVPGLHTARVVGPAGEEIHTDTHGRVKVHFHWDRLGHADEGSSCFLRVASPWAGAMRGWVSVPRIGDEVLVDFLEGDPDRPLIVGSVYNGSNLPPWALPANKTQSGLLTRSSTGGSGNSNANVLRFEDKKGSEQVWLHAEKDQLIEVEHDEEHEVGNDRHKHVGHDETTEVGNNRSESVGKDESISIGANRSESVGKNEDISIGESRSESVGKDESISIGKSREESVGENESVAIGKNREHMVGKQDTLSVGDSRSTEIGKDDQLQVGKKLVIQAGDEISLVTGSASIVMKKDGSIQITGQKISVKGSDITVKGSGKIGIKADSDLVLKGSKIAEN